MPRKILLNLHMYGGLLASGYLILLGISSLQFNHHFFPDPPAETPWNRDGAPFTTAGEVLTPETVRDQLGLFGWIGKPSIRRSQDGALHFNLNRPGRSYAITASPDGSHVQVSETRSTLFILTNLHGLAETPGSRLMAAWGIYTEFATAFGVLAVISGIYLFCSTRRDRRAAMAVFVVAGSLSLIAMAAVICGS